MAEFTQVPLGSPNTGRYVAFLEGNPAEFSDALGLHFERVRDDLDDMDAAKIRTKSGVYALLGYYLNAPKCGMNIYINEWATNPAQDLAEVLEAISKVGIRIIWKDPNL
jgi:hypothetical protein